MQLEYTQVTAPFPRAAESQNSSAVPTSAGGQERTASTKRILKKREKPNRFLREKQKDMTESRFLANW